MKKTFAMALALALSGAAMAQTTNYALSNETGRGSISAVTLTELDNQNEATLQLWLNPTAWTPCRLIAQDNFSLEMGDAQQLLFKTAGHTATITAKDLLNKWSQLTVTVKDGTVQAYINNRSVPVSGDAAPSFTATKADAQTLGCLLGEGFKGSLDEIRIWTRALEQKDFFWRNTINKFHPNHKQLAAYWKCDQNLCPQLVDYQGKHHGEMRLVNRVVSDNNAFKYRIVTGYNNLMRFIDRPYVDRDMFLMTNDVIHLSAKLLDDGSIFPEYTDNSLTGTQAVYLKEFKGRQGVLDFQGSGEVMRAHDSRTLFDPRKVYGASQKVSVATWLYLDQWTEGAEIFSQYQDADNCLVIKLGDAAKREILVDVCGTVASLSGVVTPGKWQYLSVYVTPQAGQADNTDWQPVRIAVGEMNGQKFQSTLYTRQTAAHPVTMTGKAMSITAFPALKQARLTLGNRLDGKLDECMVWGSDRSGNIQNDATKPYKLNVGNWDNTFLNSYWTGDDPQQPGRDYQSYTYMTDYMRGYFKGYRGQKIRVGIVSGIGDNWKATLRKEENLSRMIRDMKEIVRSYDGIDVDFEWMYNSGDWNLYNHIVERLAKEVMADTPEKRLTCSLHKVSYNGFNKNLFPYVDYFTFQLYGPNVHGKDYGWYTDACNKFVTWGYPKDKILMSYGALLTNGPVEGYKDLFDKYGMNDKNFDPAVNEWNCKGKTKYFNGVDMTRKKQEFILDQDVRGTMYFDMANDLRVSDPKSLIRAQNDVIASNVDTVITQVEMPQESEVHSSYSFLEGRLLENAPLHNGDLIALHSLHAPNGVRKQQGFIRYDATTQSYRFLNSQLYMEPLTHLLGSITNEALFQVEKAADSGNTVCFKAICQGADHYLKSTAEGDLTTTTNKAEARFNLIWNETDNCWHIQAADGNRYLGCAVEKPQLENTARPYNIYKVSRRQPENLSAPWFYVALLNCSDNTRNGRYMQRGQDEGDDKIWNAPITEGQNDRQVWRFEIGRNGLYALVNYTDPAGSVGEVSNGMTGRARFTYDATGKHYQFLLNEDGSLSNGAWNNNFKTFTIKRLGSGNWYLNASNNGDAYYINEWTDPNSNKSGHWTSVPAVKLKKIGDEALATFCSPATTRIPEGIRAYIATKIEGEKLILTEVYSEGILPAHTPVILRAAETGFYPFTPISNSEPAPVSGNLLRGTERERALLLPNSCYVLGTVEGKAAMYNYSGSSIAPFKAYLPKGDGQASLFRSLEFQDDATTGISSPEVTVPDDPRAPIYNLQGQRVRQPLMPGIYIRNGKKFIVH